MSELQQQYHVICWQRPQSSFGLCFWIVSEILFEIYLERVFGISVVYHRGLVAIYRTTCVSQLKANHDSRFQIPDSVQRAQSYGVFRSTWVRVKENAIL